MSDTLCIRSTSSTKPTHPPAHPRSIESDFLLIILRDLLQRRPSLKVVLMSATIEAQLFSNYMGGCPCLHIQGRTHRWR